jgi:hypothetical protein
VRVAWVHPTWRDLVIERLGADPVMRRHFLGHCGVHGIVLALSVAGGAGGERHLPLLVCDQDWDAIGDRVHALAPELEAAELVVLLEALAATLEGLQDGADADETRALSALVLARVAGCWDAGHAPLPLPALGAWLRLARRLQPPPDPPSLAVTWAELLPAGTPDPGDIPEVQRFTDWLILCRLLPPEQLAPLGWGPDQMGPIAGFIDRVAADPPRFATDAVVQALQATAQLHQEWSGRARQLTAMLLVPEMSETWAGEPPEIGELPTADGFDIDRVLADI